MKTHPFLAVIAASVAATIGLAAPTVSHPGYVHPVGSVQRATGTTITAGTPSMEVLLNLGSPTRWLDANTWVYAGYFGREQRFDDRCNNLIVTIRDGRVVSLQLGCNRAVAIIAARLAPEREPKVLVAGK